MSDDYVLAGKSLSQLFPTVEVDAKDKVALAKQINDRLLSDLKAKIVIDKLLKTDNTFLNSLGTITDYLADLSCCRNCPKSLSRCPKDGKGYLRIPYYDSDRDEILLSPRPCSYREETTRILDAIDPCSYPPNRIYKKASDRIALCKANSDVLTGTQAALAGILNDLRVVLPSSEASGASFFAPNDKGLPFSLLCAAAYFAGSAGRKVAFLDTKDFFFRLRSLDSLTKHNAVADFHKACSLPVLVLSKFDLYPYGTTEFHAMYLIPLLRARMEAGKLTYFSLTQSDKLVSVLRRILRQNDGQSEIVDWIEKNIAPVVVHDLPL
jgi:hypothetical protein